MSFFLHSGALRFLVFPLDPGPSYSNSLLWPLSGHFPPTSHHFPPRTVKPSWLVALPLLGMPLQFIQQQAAEGREGSVF